MDQCPFCHSEVSEELVRFGGRCPKCFGEIPGEESPTDPGHETRQELHKQDLEAAGRRSLVPGLLVAIALVSILGIAIYVSVREPVAPVIDLDDASYEMADVQFVAQAGEPAATEPAPAPRRVAPKSSADRMEAIRSLDVGEAGDDPDLGEEVSTSRAAPAPAPSTRQGTASASEDVVVAVAGDEALQSGAVDFGIDVGVSRRAQKGVRLTDDSAIIEMIKDVMGAELPRLKSCYEQQLKVQDDLAGRWTLAFVVDREGVPRSVSVVGQGVADPDMEACITGKVSDWSFQPIRADQPVQKTLTFRPGW